MSGEKINELLSYFSPLELNEFSDLTYLTDSGSVGNSIIINNLAHPITINDRFEMAIFTVAESDTGNSYNNSMPQQIREQFYRLKKNHSTVKIADLGNLKTGSKSGDMLFAINEVCTILLNLKINIVILSTRPQSIQGIIEAFSTFDNNLNIADVSSHISIDLPSDDIDKEAILSPALHHFGNHIYNITSLAYQSYFTSPRQISYLNSQYFEHYRLGTIRKDIKSIEPSFRDADIANFNMLSVRIQDAPELFEGSPNGLYADEACQLSRYAGISDKTQIFHFFGTYTHKNIDNNKITSKLAAQIIWYYIDGYQHRKHEYPKGSLNDCKKFEVQIDEIDFPIVFYKSNKTERWWIEIKTINKHPETDEMIIVSCTENDYKCACNNEIPERWWINFKKIASSSQK
ncbi:MAG: hypothetical protein JXR50_00810 [Prolixibacteraceae bacterium]|nr:hypothetical protein [Prolixibacteraceae bacterium]MBN2648262.1 hypothetical protein [Prolixibacteraceae bacterium]